MPAPDATGLQALIVRELGNACAPAGSRVPAIMTELQTDLPAIWSIYASKAAVPGLQYQYAKRHAVEYLLGQNWSEFDYTDEDVTEKRSQISGNLQQLWDKADAEITKLEERARGARAPAIGKITATAPVMPSGCQPDPNDRRYRGDALRRPTLRP